MKEATDATPQGQEPESDLGEHPGAEPLENRGRPGTEPTAERARDQRGDRTPQGGQPPAVIQRLLQARAGTARTHDREYRIVRHSSGAALRYERAVPKVKGKGAQKAAKRARRAEKAARMALRSRSVETVQQVKAEFEAAGADLSGPCGAFKIANEVARRVGFGLLRKRGGNRAVPLPNGGCQSGDDNAFEGYATDYIIDPATFFGVDILGDGGGANTPQWSEPETTEVQRNRDNFAPPIGGVIDPPVDKPSSNVIDRLDRIESKVGVILASLPGVLEANAQAFAHVENLIKALSDQVDHIPAGAQLPANVGLKLAAILEACKARRVTHTPILGSGSVDPLP